MILKNLVKMVILIKQIKFINFIKINMNFKMTWIKAISYMTGYILILLHFYYFIFLF